MEVLTWVSLAALAWKLTSYVKFLVNRSWSDFKNQSAAFAIGVGIAFLTREATELAGGLEVGGTPLVSMGWASTALVGLTLGGLGSAAYDFKVARDNTDSAAEPSL